MQLRVAFFGTPNLALPYLEALIEAPHSVRVVVTQPDRPAGRGRKPRPSAVKVLAEQLGIPVLQPETCRDPQFHQAIRDSGAELGVTVAYGQLLPGELLACPEHGCLNVHYSLLPALRGAAPVQRALLAGMEETGVTIQWMSAELDAGEIIIAERVRIDPDDDSAALFDRLSEVGPPLLLRALDLVARKEAPRIRQDASRVTWAPALSSEDCHIEWSEPAVRVRNRVRACGPRPGAYTLRGLRRIKVLSVEAVGEIAGKQEGQPGAIAEGGHGGHPVVWTGEGAVALVVVQPEGRRAMSGEEFARGARLEPGERLT